MNVYSDSPAKDIDCIYILITGFLDIGKIEFFIYTMREQLNNAEEKRKEMDAFNYKIILQYDGTRFNGWQKQKNTSNTIQEKIETILYKLVSYPVEIYGSGRTDAGVHARGQTANFRLKEYIAPNLLMQYINAHLPQQIAVVSAERADARFHARLCVKSKLYAYRIWNTPLRNVFELPFLYQYEKPLDENAMSQAASAFLGEHDFSAFCSVKMKKSAVRTIYDVRVERSGWEVKILCRGSGFLYNMVRIMSGSLIEVGAGARSAESIRLALENGSRDSAGMTAPPQGLILEKVIY